MQSDKGGEMTDRGRKIGEEFMEWEEYVANMNALASTRYFVTEGEPDALEVVATDIDPTDLLSEILPGQTLWKAERYEPSDESV